MTISRRSLMRGQLRAPAAQTLVATADPLLHLLNRITWGPRPEELAHAQAIGYAATLEEQLTPETLDDSAVEELLRNIPILSLSRWAAHSLDDREYRCARALIHGMVLRAVHSRRQLLERMVEFWSDHFNMPAGDLAPDLIEYQRAVIRPHALGNFRDLLLGTAKSPAMLIYLNNDSNVADAPNENWARELLELYTLGVDGGYTEADVKAVARAFTGWTTHPKTRGGFYFNPEVHDGAPKLILGHTLPAGRGIEDGLAVLDRLAHHPATAHFLCTKLCRRFVSDNPPASLVTTLTDTWQAHNGALKPVLRQLFTSAEFQAAAGAKLRRPLDFLIGALRATGTKTNHYYQLEEMLTQLGQLPYGWEPPNGYPDVAGAWSATDGLLARWNVAMHLTHSAYSDSNDSGWGLVSTLYSRLGAPTTIGELVDATASQVFGAPLTGERRAFYIDYVLEGAATAGDETSAVTPQLIGQKYASLFGLMLASPEFQWR